MLSRFQARAVRYPDYYDGNLEKFNKRLRLFQTETLQVVDILKTKGDFESVRYRPKRKLRLICVKKISCDSTEDETFIAFKAAVENLFKR